MDLVNIVIPLLALVLGYLLCEYSHRAERKDARESVNHLTNALYQRMGYKPRVAKTPVEPDVELQISVPDPKDKERKDAIAEMIPPSLEAMRAEAAILQMTKRAE